MGFLPRVLVVSQADTARGINDNYISLYRKIRRYILFRLVRERLALPGKGRRK